MCGSCIRPLVAGCQQCVNLEQEREKSRPPHLLGALAAAGAQQQAGVRRAVQFEATTCCCCCCCCSWWWWCGWGGGWCTQQVQSEGSALGPIRLHPQDQQAGHAEERLLVGGGRTGRWALQWAHALRAPPIRGSSMPQPVQTCSTSSGSGQVRTSATWPPVKRCCCCSCCPSGKGTTTARALAARSAATAACAVRCGLSGSATWCAMQASRHRARCGPAREQGEVGGGRWVGWANALFAPAGAQLHLYRSAT